MRKNEIEDESEKYAINSAIQSPKKFILRPMVFTETTHQRPSLNSLLYIELRVIYVFLL